jgi:hypothetical protein
MTKRKSMQMKTKTRRIEPVKKLIATPQKEQKPDAFQDMALIQVIEKIQEEYSVSIGVQLDIRKIGEILDYMIENSLKTVSIKFEIWRNQPSTHQPINL